MAVNFQLVDRRPADRDDAMGRSWYGWDRYATDDELWSNNRGDWRLGEAVLRERFATLSYRGIVQLVAEITGRESYGREWALTGTVLRPGDPVRDGLVGRSVRSQRNPVSYYDTADLDELSTAARAAQHRRQRVTVLATWNPENWPWDDREAQVAATARGDIVREPWSTGVRRSGIEPGDRVFLLKQGEAPRGLVGSGTCASRIYQDEHWNAARVGDEANYILVEWDTLLPDDDILPLVELAMRVPTSHRWEPQGSGTVLPAASSRDLEQLWAEHLQQPVPVPPRTSPRQGWQLDPERRKKLEDVAQDRLEQYFRDAGWEVKDVRYGNPFDAIATKPDELPLYLEAKGTETAGSSVIVSRNEVNWALKHPGQCVLGILSNVRFLPNGDVEPNSGHFRVFPWDPNKGRLEPRDHDWTPPTQQWSHSQRQREKEA